MGLVVNSCPLSVHIGTTEPGEVTVNHTGGQWLFVENVRVYYLQCALKSYFTEV